MVGKALSRHPRESYFIATKMPGYLRFNAEKAKEVFAEQLRRCQVEYFDYYMLHNMSTPDAFKIDYEDSGVLDYVLELREKGLIRNLGWSFHGNKEMLEHLLNCGVKWDFAQVQLNYHDLMYQTKVQRWLSIEPAPASWMYEKLLHANIPLVIMEPLLGGRLARLNKKL